MKPHSMLLCLKHALALMTEAVRKDAAVCSETGLPNMISQNGQLFLSYPDGRLEPVKRPALPAPTNPKGA